MEATEMMKAEAAVNVVEGKYLATEEVRQW
jgi:hypothetical protein